MPLNVAPPTTLTVLVHVKFAQEFHEKVSNATLLVPEKKCYIPKQIQWPLSPCIGRRVSIMILLV